MQRIGIDIMGSDLGPEVALEATIRFAKENKDIGVNVYGKCEFSHKKYPDNIKFIICSDVILMEDGVMKALRKPKASMVKSLDDILNNQISGMVSAGNTGAYLALANMKLKPIEGVLRPALMPIIPNIKNPNSGTLLLDAGASTEVSSDFLVQYAKIGYLFAKAALSIKEPKVMLLNIGSEPKKGPVEYVKAHNDLMNEKVNFKGNIEGRDLMNGLADVIIADGFAGNIALKVIEGTAKNLTSQIAKATLSIGKEKLSNEKLIKENLSIFDYRNTGGALLIGVNGVVVKAHGSSDGIAFYNALKLCAKSVTGEVVKKIKSSMKAN